MNCYLVYETSQKDRFLCVKLSHRFSMGKGSKSVLSDTSKRLALVHRLLQKEGVNVLRPGIPPRDRSTHSLPLSYAQQRLWFLNQLEPESPFYNIPAAVCLLGPLNVRALDEALSEIFGRHEVLRTTFPTINGRPFQLIGARQPFTLPVIDLTQLPEAERQIESHRLVMDDVRRPFVLAHGPLLRASVVRIAEKEHVLTLCAHHIVFDGRSIVIFFRELKLLYAALSHGQPSPLAELMIQYADYAVWQREWLQGEVLDRQIAYWKQQLAGAPQTLDLPADHSRPDVQSFRGAKQRFSLTTELSDSLRTLSRFEGVTLFTTLLTSWLILLSYHSRQEDLVIGTDVANRNRVELEELIGFFANQLVLRADVRGNPSFRELLRRVQTVTFGAYTHQDLPFELLVRELKPKREPGRLPLFQVKFVLVNEPGPPLELSDLKVEPMGVEIGVAKFDLLLTLVDTQHSLVGSLEYNTDLMESDRIVRILENFQALLYQIAHEPDARIQELKERLEEENREQTLRKEARLKEALRQRLKNVKPKSIRAAKDNFNRTELDKISQLSVHT